MAAKLNSTIQTRKRVNFNTIFDIQFLDPTYVQELEEDDIIQVDKMGAIQISLDEDSNGESIQSQGIVFFFYLPLSKITNI